MSNSSPHKKELVGWAYVRVSTPDQGHVLHGSVEQQQNRIKRWETEQGRITGIEHKITRFIDEDISGRAESLHKRREYHELFMAIKRGAIDFVVVERLDRLHRNQIENRRFVDLCDSMGVKFYRLDGGLVDLKDRSSRTSLFIESWMAEEYSLDLVEKLTKKGREARVNNGKDCQSMPILGLDEHPSEACFYVINKAEQEIVKDIFKYFVACGDLQKTASYCNKKKYCTKQRLTRPKVEKGKKVGPKQVGGVPFNRKNLRSLLVNRKIAGFGFFKDDWKQFPQLQDEKGMVRWEFRHGPVIDPELFKKAQERLKKNAKHNHRIYKDQRTYLLSGILFDACGNRFHGASAKNRKNFYYVNSKKKYRIPAPYIEHELVKYLSNVLRKNGMFEQALSQLGAGENDQIKELDREIKTRERESLQCERVLQVISLREREQILNNPECMDDVLRERVCLRNESEARIDILTKELEILYERKEEIEGLVQHQNTGAKLRSALKVFNNSWSLRKKQLIQIMVPKAVIDEKNNQLKFFINPILDESLKNNGLGHDDIEPIFTIKPKLHAGPKLNKIGQGSEKAKQKADTVEEKSSSSGRVAECTSAMQTFSPPRQIAWYYALLCRTFVQKFFFPPAKIRIFGALSEANCS